MSSASKHTIRTVLFDLDGTLLDTAPDLAYALNLLLREEGLAELPFDKIRGVVSHGGRALIELGFDLPPEHTRFEPLRKRLLDTYKNNIAKHTTLFPGMDAVLTALDQRDINWGIVTNKPAFLTEPLLKELQLDQHAACIVCGDTLAQRKPHKAPMLLACEQAGSQNTECVYIGDAQRDIEAGKNAGMKTLVALFGYFTEDDQPGTWGADGEINHPEEIIAWLDQNSR